jgi:hypothetical protein
MAHFHEWRRAQLHWHHAGRVKHSDAFQGQKNCSRVRRNEP